ncbi:glycolate oxidase subunit GlcE [Rhodoferax saidenbachensis]|uniref:Glycolate oxidase subunit GlcE n=1 Tax=Rhodoferax saidenbachensis TaxID=1484693 RepID=A0A1P8K5K7_9BURK|nr:glycolate oxidase subunit GlcE [Rhodoferax saidenbachensis]APW41293.1 glycolate oxidase subunit GlcE [Rhodoferax saidenbachensis]
MLSPPGFDTALRHATDQVQAAVAACTPLCIRGGRSKDFYVGQSQGQVLDTTALRGILSYEPSELVVTVAAGTPLAELEAVLAEKGQCLPFEPPHFTWSQPNRATPAEPLGERFTNSGIATGSAATIGGMVASGLAGPARASVGGVRDYVLGLKLLNGRAEHLTFGGQVMKNVAGYDVSRLMVGALGTLGLITEVSLKVLPRAPAEATLVFALDQTTALEHLHRWGGQPLPLNASRWEPVAQGAGQLWVRLRGAIAAVEAACQTLLRDVPGERVAPSDAASGWEQCRNQIAPFFQRPTDDSLALWRLSVAQTAPVMNLPWAPLVEWHGGLRWLWAPADAAVQLQSAALAARGNATVFVAARAHSTGATGQFGTENPVQAVIAQRLKAAFDPHGIFNPSLTSDANHARA